MQSRLVTGILHAGDTTFDEVSAVLRQAKENGKAVIGMKILGEGQLAGEREACIQFAQELGLLDAMTVGCINPEQIDDILHLIAKYPVHPIDAAPVSRG